jgi:hypothetical protein
MESVSTKNAGPIIEPGGHNIRKRFVYAAKGPATTETYSGSRVGVGTGLVLLSTLLIQSGAGAGDFSSRTVNPLASYSGIRMQQGNPQLDHDKTPTAGRPFTNQAPQMRNADMQRGKIAGGLEGVKTIRRENSSVILCGSKCRN